MKNNTPNIQHYEARQMLGNFCDCITDLIIDCDPEDQGYERGLINQALIAFGHKDITKIRQLVADGFTMLLLSEDPDLVEGGFDGIIIMDGQEFVGFINKSEMVW